MRGHSGAPQLIYTFVPTFPSRQASSSKQTSFLVEDGRLGETSKITGQAMD